MCFEGLPSSVPGIHAYGIKWSQSVYFKDLATINQEKEL